MAPSVDVLLSVHNPNQPWLDELLESIASQTTLPTRLIIRLDGDFPLLWNSKRLIKKVDVLDNKTHLGFARSFLTLLEHTKADFAMFCDQDDVWLENKIHNLVKVQSNISQPTISFCKFQVIDANGKVLKYRQYIPKKFTKFTFLFSNGIPGNTMMLNQSLVDLVRKSIAMVGAPTWHDWWALSIAREFGEIIESNSEDMKYRIHSMNAVGLQTKRLQKIWSLVRSQSSTQWLPQVEMLIKFMRLSDTPKDQTQFLEQLVLNYSKKRFSRLCFLLRSGIIKSDPIDFLQAIRCYILTNTHGSDFTKAL
jgi:glycosyltransferase involved in cell wall biosynthesis